jgi:hypothetical protein
MGPTTRISSGVAVDCVNIRCWPVATVLACMTWSSSVLAQATAPAPSPATSAPVAAKPRPSPLTPQQLRESATSPGELRPEHAPVPQINVPLGRKPAVPVKPQSGASRRGQAEPADGIDDAVARCEAQSDRQVRADCRNRLAIEGRKR